MKQRILCFTFIVLISIPQVTPVFFDALDDIFKAAKGEEDFLGNDLEAQLLAARAYGQPPVPLVPIAPGVPLGHGLPLGPARPFLPIGQVGPSALGPIGPVGPVGPLGPIPLGGVGPIGGVGGGRYIWVSDNGLVEEEEPKGIFGGIKETIGNLIGFGKAEEEELVLPQGPNVEHHIHTYDLVPPPLGIPIALPPRPLLPPPPGLPIGGIPLQGPVPYLGLGGGIPNVLPQGGLPYPGLPYRKYF